MIIKDGIHIEKEAEYAIILEKYYTLQLVFEWLSKDANVSNLQKEVNPYWGQDIIYFNYQNTSFVILSSTGAPCAAIAIERLKRTGVQKIICLGTCGSTHESIKPGTYILSLAAVRDEGTTLGYLDIKIPAVANLELTLKLETELNKQNHVPLIGTTFTTDKRFKEDQNELSKLYYHANILNIDMETSSYLLVSRYYNIAIAVLKIVTDCAVTETSSSFKGIFNLELHYEDFIKTYLYIALKCSLITLYNESL